MAKTKFHQAELTKLLRDPVKAHRTFNKLGRTLERKVRVPRKTGKLAKGTGYRIIRDTRYQVPFKLQFGSRAEYASVVNDGSRPHDIWASNASQVLIWANKQVFVSTKYKPVKHPGTRPTRYIYNAALGLVPHSRIHKRR